MSSQSGARAEKRGMKGKTNSFSAQENIYWKPQLQDVEAEAERRNVLWWIRHYLKRAYRVGRRNPKRFFYHIFHTLVFRRLYSLFCLFPICEHKVLFLSDAHDKLSGNFEFVYKELAQRDPKLRPWFLLKGSVHERKTLWEHLQLAYHLATAQLILLDDVYTMVYYLKIREGAELIQLWHAVGAFKTFGFSRIGRPGGPPRYSVAHRNYTKAIVSSKSVIRHYAEGFGISEDKIVATGIPRTDVFFQEEYKNKIRKMLYEKYPYLKNKKVILYTPTFRGNGAGSAYFPQEVLEFEKLFDGCHEDYVCLVKMHPFVKAPLEIPERCRNFVFDFTDYPNVNDLLFVTDVLITDYSSVCFEAALLKIPMLFFAFDLEEYISSRDFYYQYETFVPGSIVRTMDEIVSCIQRENFDLERQKAFVEYFFDAVDGRSTERVVDMLMECLEPSKHLSKPVSSSVEHAPDFH